MYHIVKLLRSNGGFQNKNFIIYRYGNRKVAFYKFYKNDSQNFNVAFNNKSPQDFDTQLH